MLPVTAPALLHAWENGIGRSPVDKALLILEAAAGEDDTADPALLSLGQRDARLLQVRERIFGTKLMNQAHCPSCGEHIEWVTDTTDILSDAVPDRQPVSVISADGYSLRFRLLNSNDLRSATPGATAGAVLKSCIVSAAFDGQNIEADQLPEKIYEAMGNQLAVLDPMADISMALDCPACLHHWDLQFDIVEYLWKEIDNWAKKMLREVALMAAAFGWTESAILNMNPRRRQYYLNLIRK